MQFIHRSVGEPAEGSLTRYPYVNQRELFSPSLCGRLSGVRRDVERDCFGSLVSAFYFCVTEMSSKTLYLSWGLISPRALLSRELCGVLYYTLISPFASWLYFICRIRVHFHSGSARWILIYLNVKITTLSNGYLGSRNDEERSEMRYVMRIAEFSESSNLWTQIALLGSPRSTPLSVSVQPSLSSVCAASLCVVCACWLDNESLCACMQSLEIHGVSINFRSALFLLFLALYCVSCVKWLASLLTVAR